MNNIHEYLTTVDFVVVVLYLVLLVAVGFWVSFIKKKKSEKNLFLAGNSLNWSKIGFTMWGTNVGPSMLIASCSIGYTTGIVAGNFSWLAFIFIFLLAFIFAPKYLGANVTTIPEYMGKRFGNSTRNILAWYTTLTILISWLSLTLYAGGILVEQILNISLLWSIVLLITISAFFTIAGGLEAIAVTNVFQMILLIIVSLALTIVGFYNVGGISTLVDATPREYWNLFLPNDNENYPWLAILLGYPVLAVWFWCTDQSMVQSVLGAKNLKEGQLGANFTGWLKILDVPLFILPGILCFVLFPELNNPDEAYMTMVTRLFPIGMKGLVMAVLVAALISTIDSALNSLSTVFTMDIYLKKYNSKVSNSKIIKTGRLVTIIGSLLSVFLTLVIANVKGLNLFDLFQAVLGFLAPPMTAVFLSGVLWKKTSSSAVNIALSFGTAFSILIGILYLFIFPTSEYDFWPHFLLLSFFIYVVIQAQIIVVSLFSKVPTNADFTLFENKKTPNDTKKVKILWGALIVLMISFYILFNGHESNPKKALPINKELIKKSESVRIIEVIFNDSHSLESPSIDSLLLAYSIDKASILNWKNHIVFNHQSLVSNNEFIEGLKSLKLGEIKAYSDVIYEFGTEDCNNISNAKKTKQYLLSVNLVSDVKKQKEYLEYHKTQKEKWPELTQGFCKEGFHSLEMLKSGRQIMLIIGIPEKMDLGNMSEKNEKNPRVKDWNDLMGTFQEGLPGTSQTEKWVLFQ
ncbi:MAG: sodium:solute symporter family transporter [Jejuia sp.]